MSQLASQANMAWKSGGESVHFSLRLFVHVSRHANPSLKHFKRQIGKGSRVGVRNVLLSSPQRLVSSEVGRMPLRLHEKHAVYEGCRCSVGFPTPRDALGGVHFL